MTVDGRCATISAVVDASTRRSAASTSASVSTSSADSGSSSTSTAGLRRDRPGEREPLPLAAGQAQPLLADHRVDAVGQVVARSPACAISSASASTASPPRRPVESAGRAARCRARTPRTGSRPRTPWRCAGAARRACRSRMSTPSSRIAPPVTSYSRVVSAVSVDLPEPVRPTSAMVSPGSSSRSTPSSRSR